MLHALLGKRPQLGHEAFVAPGARVIGDVRLGDEASVWYNAVLRGDTEPIRIGSGSNIQDGSVVHADPGFPTSVGRGVTVGHSCILHGCQIGDETLIGMGSIILNGARIGSNCLIGAGSLITEGKEFPDGSLIFGRPAKVVRPLEPQELEQIRRSAAVYMANARSHKAHVSEL